MGSGGPGCGRHSAHDDMQSLLYSEARRLRAPLCVYARAGTRGRGLRANARARRHEAVTNGRIAQQQVTPGMTVRLPGSALIRDRANLGAFVMPGFESGFDAFSCSFKRSGATSLVSTAQRGARELDPCSPPSAGSPPLPAPARSWLPQAGPVAFREPLVTGSLLARRRVVPAWHPWVSRLDCVAARARRAEFPVSLVGARPRPRRRSVAAMA